MILYLFNKERETLECKTTWKFPILAFGLKRIQKEESSFLYWPLTQHRDVFISFPNIVAFPELMNTVIHSPFTEKCAGDDESDVDGITAHDKFVKAFESAFLISPSSVLHD
jgi:hypothetical protein